MKKGICLTALYPQAVEDSVLLMDLFRKVKAEKLFDCVEFYFRGTPEEERQIGRTLKELELSAVFLAGFPMKQDKVDISAQNDTVRRGSVVDCIRLYESAVRIQADSMLIVSGPAWETPDRDGVIRQMRKSLQEIGRKLYPEGPGVSLEFFNDKGEPWLAVGDIALVKEVFTGLSAGKIGITFDTSHTAQLGADVLTSFGELKPWIHHLHLANSVSEDEHHPLFGDKHPLFSLKGGDFSLEEIRKIYQTLEQNGDLEQVDFCSFEVISREEENFYYEKTCEEAAFVWR